MRTFIGGVSIGLCIAYLTAVVALSHPTVLHSFKVSMGGRP